MGHPQLRNRYTYVNLGFELNQYVAGNSHVHLGGLQADSLQQVHVPRRMGRDGLEHSPHHHSLHSTHSSL